MRAFAMLLLLSSLPAVGACSPSGGGDAPSNDATSDGPTHDASPADSFVDSSTSKDAGDANADTDALDATDTSIGVDTFDAAGTVTPYTCPPSSPLVVFVGETPPPATLAPWSHAIVTVTWANCGTTAWRTAAPPDGVAVGPSAPHDLDTFTPGRVALPTEVPPSHAVTVTVELHAPPLVGPHAFALELVQDGVAWLGAPSPTHAIDVEPASSAAIAICPGITADPSFATDARAALQSCIDATPSGGTLALPAGVYRLSGVLHLDKPMTLTTTGATGASASCIAYDAPPCATFVADASVSPKSEGTRGFFRIGELSAATSNVTLDHVVVDGNRGARLGSAAASGCASGSNGEGINVGASCASCTIVGSASTRALCGSGMEWDGDGIVVRNSVFLGNGDHATTNMWSDGLTLHKSDAGVVDHCRFVDNSDVGLISGGGVGAKYTSNVAYQLSQTAFAAIMLDNFDSPTLGDHTGAEMSGNSVACPAGCHFGIELGPHPWYASPNIVGGTVTGNTVVGANIEINAQGAGTAAQPTVIFGNTLGPTPSSATFQCGSVSGLSPLNVSAESIVDLKGGAATGSVSVPCP